VGFNRDGCRARRDNSPENLNLPRKAVLSRLRAIDAGKWVRIKWQMLRTSLNPDFFHPMLFGRYLLSPWGIRSIDCYLRIAYH
jgi:hypothetical protein